MLQPHRPGPVVVVLEKVDSYQAQIVSGVRSELIRRGIPVLIFVSGVTAGAMASLSRVVRHPQVLGVLLTAASDPARHLAVEDLLTKVRPLPVVHIGLPEGEVHVRGDNRQGMRLIARHLVDDCGARRIAAVRGPAHQQDSREREVALRAELAMLGVSLPDDLVVDGEFNRSRAYQAVRDLLASGVRVDAVAALNDRCAFGAVDALTAAGLRVPEDVVVTGFDDEDVSSVTCPSLTTVDQNLGEQGALAARLLLQLAAGRKVRSARVAVQLRRRATTGERTPATGTEGRLQARLLAADVVLEVSRSVLAAPTVENMVERVASQLPGLGVRRAFLVLRTDDQAALGEVVLSYRDGMFENVAGQTPFDLDALLPEHLADQLQQGTLVLQPLVAGENEFGHLLIDQTVGDETVVSEALGLDLSRVLDGIRTTKRLARYAEELQALVAERTGQLEAEVRTRREAEAELRKVNAELRESLHVDGLTGIANRKALEQALLVQWSGHSRSGQALSLLMIDVDHFKAFNDRYGHPQGDEALRVVAHCLVAATRRVGDLAARYGGEEFAVLLPNTGPDGALVVANRLRRLVARAAIPHGDSPVQQRLTVSIGVASTYPDALGDFQELITAADAALYDVKDAGRDGIASTRGCPRLTEAPTA